ncbi:MAG: D-alanyl-D-alanine carboxypeptidase/D-alanyl-D-alanine-endopeptidase [Prevotella sp.]|nr:D-alanyl-D-alanine carboxypeptidase/D-alanyl-D-alanine-endopeptidase [Prevotella sp.]
MKEDVPYGEGWCWDDKNPILSPLTIGRDTAFVSRLRAALEPTPDPSRREGSLVSAKGPTPDPSQREGSLAAVKEPTPNPSRREVSLATIKAETNQAPLPSGGVGGGFNLATCTHTIDQLLRRMLKESDNFYAEALFYQTAASQGSRPAKASHARAATKRLISRIGLGGQPYRIADGSGLSLYNYVSAELETMLLRYAWQKPAIYSHLYPALPIAGVDGTLKKRMTGTAAGGNVHAKTGTLTGVISLAGYCTAANGHRLCFAIINQGVMTGSTARTFQDRLCRILCEP